MGKMSPQAALGFLMLLAVVSWGIVVGELVLTGTVSIFAIANAAVFTVTLALWPILTGTRVSGGTVQIPDSCRECGAMALAVPGIRFCLHCGAYPKLRALTA
ncbi:MAG: hypothetical protein ABR562_07200 [Thermoplasmatota archaeon]